MGRIFGPKTAFHGLLIRTAFRALGFWPDARRYFAEMRYKPAPQFREGFLIAKQRTSRGLVGRMLPQPRLEELAAGKRLDDLLGLGFSLVGIGMEPGDLEQLSFGPFWDELLQRRVPLRGRNLGALEAFRGSALIVRPDRYVMGVVTHANIAAVREQLDALVDGTWFAPAQQAKAQQRHLQALVNDALLNTRGF
jgi:3-(3-hydroxy-phenyl)propionate hydroxylase